MKNINVGLHSVSNGFSKSTDKLRFVGKIKNMIVPAVFGALIGILSTNLYLFITRQKFVTHIVVTVCVGLALGSFAGVFIVKVIEGRFRIKDFLSIIIAIIFSLICSKLMFDLFGS